MTTHDALADIGADLGDDAPQHIVHARARFGPGHCPADDETTVVRGGASGTWFEAASLHGPLRLWIGGAAAQAAHAAGAAIELQRCDELLDALDDWSDDGLDWRWMPTPAGGLAGDTHALVGWRDAPCRLLLPWRWLRSLPAPPDALAAALHWPAVDAVLAVARLRLAADELAQLEPGGALLLPPSLQPGWQGMLRGADEPCGAGVAVELGAPGAPRVVAAGATAGSPTGFDDDDVGADAGTPCEVRLTARQALPADRLAGWHGGALPGFGPGAALWRSAADGRPEHCLATGCLIPWGDGRALRLEIVCGDRDATTRR